MNTNGYQGYTNYPTWNIALWIDNDEGLSDEVNSEANRAIDTYKFKQWLKDYCREVMLDNELQGAAADIFGWACEQIDWNELAELYIEANGGLEQDDESAAESI